MITIFNAGQFDYSDANIDKPVRYSVQNLIDVASRTPNVNITKEHSKDVIGVMSNFIVEDGLLKAEEPNNLELKGMGFSPVFEFDLLDKGDYYVPMNILMKEIGYTSNPRTQIVYNSIEVENNGMTDDKQLRDTLDANKKLNEEIGVYKSQIKQLKKANTEKDKEIQKIKDTYSDTDEKLKEYESLKKIEASYNSLISSKKDDLLHKICGDNESERAKFEHMSVEDLENIVTLSQGSKGGKGITPQTNPVDDGNDPVIEDEEEEYTDEMFEEEFKASGL